MLKAVEKKRAYQDVVSQILTLIKGGKLKKGDQLPTERDLAESLKVSRTTVREAIRSLESMKMVESRQGNGTYVLANKDIEVQNLCSALFHERDDLMDIFHVRNIIEPSIAQLAAERATPAEIKELENIVDQHEANLSAGSTTIDTDTAFHMALAQAAKNRVLGRLINALIDLLAESRQAALQSGRRGEESLKGHRNILLAIEKGDGTAAKDAMRRHLGVIEDLILPGKKGGKKRK
jgi:GntR family transcriptional regulator, transcriptional repressor for pyruvate dehydrogenase complex